MEKLHTDLNQVLKAIGYPAKVIVKLNRKANRVELEIPYLTEGFAEKVYNRIKDAIS